MRRSIAALRPMVPIRTTSPRGGLGSSLNTGSTPLTRWISACRSCAARITPAQSPASTYSFAAVPAWASVKLPATGLVLTYCGCPIASTRSGNSTTATTAKRRSQGEPDRQQRRRGWRRICAGEIEREKGMGRATAFKFASRTIYTAGVISSRHPPIAVRLADLTVLAHPCTKGRSRLLQRTGQVLAAIAVLCAGLIAFPPTPEAQLVTGSPVVGFQSPRTRARGAATADYG